MAAYVFAIILAVDLIPGQMTIDECIEIAASGSDGHRAMRQQLFTDEKAAQLALYGSVRPCIERGCPNYATGDGTRCKAHSRQRARERWSAGLTGRRGSRPGWRRLRATVIEEQHGVCAHCRRAAELELHHIDGNAHNDARHNLEALCHGCHQAAGR